MNYGQWWFEHSPENKNRINADALFEELKTGNLVDYSEISTFTHEVHGLCWRGKYLKGRPFIAYYTDEQWPILQQEIRAAQFRRKYRKTKNQIKKDTMSKRTFKPNDELNLVNSRVSGSISINRDGKITEIRLASCQFQENEQVLASIVPINDMYNKLEGVRL